VNFLENYSHGNRTIFHGNQQTNLNLVRYVRCIKPNMDKRANDYNVDLVRDQLKYLGMLEIIRIRREGYPIHFPFTQFVKRFKIIGKFRTYRPVKDIATLVNFYFTLATKNKVFSHANSKKIFSSWKPKNNFFSPKK
jgi:myosin heavy subunit